MFDMPLTDCFGEADTEAQYRLDENGVRTPNPGRGAASFEHFIAIGLQMIMRNMIKGPCPAKHIAKPEVGTGGSLMVKVLHNIFTGEDPSDIPLSSLPESFANSSPACFAARAAICSSSTTSHPITSTCRSWRSC